MWTSLDGDLKWKDIAYFVNETVACVVGFVANIVLLLIIKHRTPKQVASYATVLQVHCYANIVHVIINSFCSVVSFIFHLILIVTIIQF